MSWDTATIRTWEPGEAAIRAFVDRAGHPATTFEDDEDVIRGFEDANSQAITRLHRDRQLPGIAWIQLIPDTPDRRAPPALSGGVASMVFGARSGGPAAVPGFPSVHIRLGPDDLATVDALINAGIAASRADVMRWAIGR